MKRSTFALAFYIKRNKLMRDGEAPIYARITINGQRAEFGLKRSIFSGALSLNEYIDGVWSRIQEVRKQLEHNDLLKERIDSLKTQAAKKRFLQAYVDYLSNIVIACKAARIHRNTYYKWKKNDPEFAEQYWETLLK